MMMMMMMIMMIMMIVDLYSALRRAPLLRYVSRCIVKRTIFSADRKDPILSDGSRRWSGSRFQTIGPATLECPTSEPTATMTWYDQLMASGRSETSTTVQLLSWLAMHAGKLFHTTASVTTKFTCAEHSPRNNDTSILGKPNYHNHTIAITVTMRYLYSAHYKIEQRRWTRKKLIWKWSGATLLVTY